MWNQDVWIWFVGNVLFIAALFDLKERRVPNWLCFGAMFVVAIFWWMRSPLEMLCYFVRLLLAVVVLSPFFAVRVLGAGDVKMMAFMVGSLGVSAGFCALGCGFAAGALMAVWKMAVQHSFWRRMEILVSYVRQACMERMIAPYYQAERDRVEGVIPFTVSLFLGFLGSIALKTYGSL